MNVRQSLRTLALVGLGASLGVRSWWRGALAARLGRRWLRETERSGSEGQAGAGRLRSEGGRKGKGWGWTWGKDDEVGGAQCAFESVSGGGACPWQKPAKSLTWGSRTAGEVTSGPVIARARSSHSGARTACTG